MVSSQTTQAPAGRTSTALKPTLQDVPNVSMYRIIVFNPQSALSLGEVSTRCAGLARAYLQNSVTAIVSQCDRAGGFRSLSGGIVDRAVDYHLCRSIVDLARGNGVAFHKSVVHLISEHFEECPDVILSPEEVLGYARLLTERRLQGPSRTESHTSFLGLLTLMNHPGKDRKRG